MDKKIEHPGSGMNTLKKESDPRIIESRVHKNPINLTYYIDEIVFRIYAHFGKNKEEFDSQPKNALALTAFVRDEYYLKEENPNYRVNPQKTLSLAEALEL